MSYSNGRLDCRVYVGNIPKDCTESDLDSLFFKFGQINYISIKKTVSGNLFAFIEFDDPRDAEDAVYARHRYLYNGSYLRVEFCRGGRAIKRSIGPNEEFNFDDEEYRCSRILGSGYRTAPPGRRSDYRILVYDLPNDICWQDLKTHMREAGSVSYCEIARDGTGVVEYERYDDMKWALKHLNGTKLESMTHEDYNLKLIADPKSIFSDSRPIKRMRTLSPSPTESIYLSKHSIKPQLVKLQQPIK